MRDERAERADLPERLYRYLQLLLSHDPNERPTIEEILQGIKAGAAFSEQASQNSTGETSPISGPREQSPPLPFQPDSGMRRRPTRPTRSSFRGRPMSPPDEGYNSGAHDSVIAQKQQQQQSTSEDDDSLVVRTDLVAHSSSGSATFPRLLEPPPKASKRAVKEILTHTQTQKTMKLALLAVKLWSVFESCAPMAPRPLLLYFVLALATCDLIDVSKFTIQSAGLLLLHVIAIALFFRRGDMCNSLVGEE